MRAPSDTEPATIDELKKTFPTVIRSECGSMIWLTRLSSEDRRAATAYESDYARWIPEKAVEALRAILTFTDSMSAVIDALSNFSQSRSHAGSSC